MAYLFPKGGTYLRVNKYLGSSYFSVSNYWGVLVSGEYLLTVTTGTFGSQALLTLYNWLAAEGSPSSEILGFDYQHGYETGDSCFSNFIKHATENLSWLYSWRSVSASKMNAGIKGATKL